MKITIESTDQITTLDGVPVRVWRGVTERGVECEVYVHRLAVAPGAGAEQFDRELKKCLPPGRHVPLSLIL